jgi:cytochrome d ubiquinol oxidase subunit II
MGMPEILAGVMLVSLVLYAVLGGADFGGGIWDLLATGPRAKAQRALIDRAIAPVWEANHVWLILIVVILFTAFPKAYSAASVWLHIPLTLMLIGIVFRGSAFVFRHYDVKGDPFQRRWGRVFAMSSIASPFFLGVSLGAVTSGRLEVDVSAGGDFVSTFVLPWLHPFPMLVGLFALGLFAFLAAVYLTVEAPERELQDDFRRRALAAGGVSIVVAAVTASGAAFPELVHVRERILGAWWTWALAAIAAAVWLGALYALYTRRYIVARVLAVGLVTLVLCGWALGQYPYLISPGITLRNAAAPAATLRPLLIALALGALVLFPAMYWLFRVFKRRPAFAPLEDEGSE